MEGVDFEGATMPDGKKYDPGVHTVEMLTGRKPIAWVISSMDVGSIWVGGKHFQIETCQLAESDQGSDASKEIERVGKSRLDPNAVL